MPAYLWTRLNCGVWVLFYQLAMKSVPLLLKLIHYKIIEYTKICIYLICQFSGLKATESFLGTVARQVFIFGIVKTDTFSMFPLNVYYCSEKGRWLWFDPAWSGKPFSPLKSTGLKCQCDSAIHSNVMSFMAFHGTGTKWSSNRITSKTIYGYTAMCGLGQRQ